MVSDPIQESLLEPCLCDFRRIGLLCLADLRIEHMGALKKLGFVRPGVRHVFLAAGLCIRQPVKKSGNGAICRSVALQVAGL